MDQDVTFARDIRPLFNDRDIGSMSASFDLSSYDDVRANAEPIYGRLADGTMPCYGPWPADNVERFRAWITTVTPRRQANRIEIHDDIGPRRTRL